MSLNKSHVLSTIQHSLYHELREKVVRIYAEIHISQQRLVENSSGGFWFKGMRYQSGIRGGAQSLHPALHEFMEDYVTQSKDMDAEKSYVTSYVQSILNQCTEESQLYCLLPHGLHSILRDEGLDETPTSNLGRVPTTDFNQKGKELLLARMMLNMTGS